MKLVLSIGLSFILMSFSLNLEIEKSLLNYRWVLLEAKSEKAKNISYFTNQVKSLQANLQQTALTFKDNGVLIEKHENNTDEPFFISNWKKFQKGDQEYILISHSRHWTGTYLIKQLDHHQLQLKN